MTVAGAQGGKPEPNMSTHSLDSIVRTVGCVGNKQGAMEGSGQTSDHTPKTYPGSRVGFGGQAKTGLYLEGLGRV